MFYSRPLSVFANFIILCLPCFGEIFYEYFPPSENIINIEDMCFIFGGVIMQKITAAAPQNIILENRKNLRISGVRDIDSFTENKIVLSTVMGELVIKGDDLHVNSLDAESGDFSMTGSVNSLSYNRHSVLDGPVKKLFR